ncbi:hypothetical protein HK104_008920 [Borealophlyctis nickersoniae]|nr:hypothetical protein HK104_008920 [Borealophlyctis nickersoniae]
MGIDIFLSVSYPHIESSPLCLIGRGVADTWTPLRWQRKEGPIPPLSHLCLRAITAEDYPCDEEDNPNARKTVHEQLYTLWTTTPADYPLPPTYTPCPGCCLSTSKEGRYAIWNNAKYSRYAMVAVLNLYAYYDGNVTYDVEQMGPIVSRWDALAKPRSEDAYEKTERMMRACREAVELSRKCGVRPRFGFSFCP